MSTVVARARSITQPWGGYIRPKSFEKIILNDGMVLSEEENIPGNIVGMAVEGLAKINIGIPVADAFRVSIQGALLAEKYGTKKAIETAFVLSQEIKELDVVSIVNACKLVRYEVWYRNPFDALMSEYIESIPNKATIRNIQILVRRCLLFFEKYGQPKCYDFSFEPVIEDKASFAKMVKTRKGSYGGYTAIVSGGEGDFLTEDTLWDIKVSNYRPTSKHTLQLAMYWIMGLHSGQEKYKSIKRLGIYNPRSNIVYLLNTVSIPQEIIQIIEREVICYPQ